MRISGRRALGIGVILLLITSPGFSVKPKNKEKQSPTFFGGQNFIPGALRGTVYRLAKGTNWLPDFSRLRPVGIVYTNVIDYQLREYGDEWFGIVYEGTFHVSKPGEYEFTLTSDDGAQLYIDGKRIINNDGIHAVESKDNFVHLAAGPHHLRLPYFQGPLPYVALVLEVQQPRGKKRLFNMDDFRPPVLPEPDSNDHPPTLKRK